MTAAAAPLSWSELQALADSSFVPPDVVRGPANAHTHTRLFDAPDGTVPDVILYRDNHYWCPYCEKLQLYLETKRIPYSIKLVTMFCYGQKEAWYKKVVPNGMLPALQLTPGGKVITESDEIMVALERKFGPIQPGKGMSDAAVVEHRRRERTLFRAWCNWLCYPASSRAEETQNREAFIRVARGVEEGMGGRFMLGAEFSTADIVYIPYLERMNASLFYYKAYDIRREHPKIDAWFSALEQLDCYRGIISDFHTHSHDLPPQMGGCYAAQTPPADEAAALVDEGPFTAGLLGKQVDSAAYPEPDDSRAEAAWRVIKHHETLEAISPFGAAAVDEGLRATLTLLLTGRTPSASATRNVDSALRQIRDRISIPRDMPIWSGMRLRDALESTAQLYGRGRGHEIAQRDRYDSNPAPFKASSAA